MLKKNEMFKDFDKSFPWLIILVTVFYLVAVLQLCYWVDIKFSNVFGLNDWLQANYDSPVLWLQMFREGSPTEYLQWFYLGLAALLCMSILVWLYKQKIKFNPGWILLLLGLVTMFLEDVFNLRHFFSEIVAIYILEYDDFYDWVYSLDRSIVEVSVYILLSIIMVVALIFILKDRKVNLFGKKLMVVGYFFYGVAAFGSATRHIGDWYGIVGRKILLSLYHDYWLPMIEIDYNFCNMFMDYVFEESLELLGASFLLASVVVFFVSLVRRNDKEED